MKKFHIIVLTALAALVTHAENRTLSVQQLFDLTDACSAPLAVTRTGVEAAQQGVEAARRQRLPDINASLSLSYLGNTLITNREFGDAVWAHTPHFGNSLSLEVQQVVYAGGAINAGIRIAELKKENAEVASEVTRQQQRFLALGQYLDIFKLNNRMQVYEKNIALTERLIDDIKEKQAQGMALRNDVTRYELQMQNLLLGLTTLRNRRAVLNHQLCNTLALPDTVTIVPDTSLVQQEFSVANEATWQQQAASTSPVLRQSAIGARIAEQNERVERSALRPRIALFAADNLNGPITFEIPPLNKNINAWRVGVGVTYNLGALYKNNSKVRQAQLATRQSREALTVARQGIDNAVQAAHTDYLQSLVELDTQRKSVQLAQQNYEVMNERYLNQLALVTEMVDASNLKLNAELLEVDARINTILAYYKMHYLAGTL
ncbi:MAG: TolC family protein [Muribaculaceae bacterium]|nr:TolC family protein [Muribaculaceae bacterium]